MSKVEEVNKAKMENPAVPKDGEDSKVLLPEVADKPTAKIEEEKPADSPKMKADPQPPDAPVEQTVEQVVAAITNGARGVIFPGGPASEGRAGPVWAPITPEVNSQANTKNTLVNVKKLTGVYKRYPQYAPNQTTIDDTLVKWDFPVLAAALKQLENVAVYHFTGGPYDVYVFSGTYKDMLITAHAACRKMP